MDCSKSSRNKEIYNGVDRISDLPDSIICFILSFLETRDAVETRLLSKRWRHLWTEVPVLLFNISVREKYINRTMLLHKAQSLDKFLLYSEGNYVRPWVKNHLPSNFTAWIRIAIDKNVRELDLCFRKDYEFIPLPLPDSLFTCKSLEILSLSGNFTLQVPSFVSLPRLRHIYLSRLSASIGSLGKLINGCPMLKCVDIDTKFNGRDVISISSPTLERLTIQDRVSTLSINAPLLEYLSMSTDKINDFRLENRISDVVEVSTLYFNYDPDDFDYVVDPCDWIFKLVQGIDYVKNLTLDHNSVAFFHAATHVDAKFLNLTKLTLKEGKGSFKWLLRFLGTCMNLEVLNIGLFRRIPHYQRCRRKQEKYDHDNVPECVEYNLQRISISDFKGSKSQLEMIEYFLKHGGVLKRLELHGRRYGRRRYIENSDDEMVVEMVKKFDDDGISDAEMVKRIKDEMVKKISGFDRKSAACEIIFFGR